MSYAMTTDAAKTPIEPLTSSPSFSEKHKKYNSHLIDTGQHDKNYTIFQSYDEKRNTTTTYVRKDNGISSEVNAVGENGKERNCSLCVY